jgi:RNA polymerase sigma-70 factor (ECF subfamily)
MTDASDFELAELAAGGDEDAFTRLLERHYDLIFKIAFSWCGDRHEAEDVAQEVCVKLARGIGSFDGRSKFETWLYRVTVNTAKDSHRARKRYVREAQAELETALMNFQPATGPERHVALTRALDGVNTLPAKLRDAVMLVYVEDLSHKEAAQVLGCAEATISWRIFKARRKLKAMWSV